MDSFELNKMVGAFLGTVFIIFTIALVSDSIFYSPVPKQEGFAIAAVEPDGHGGQAAEEPAGLEPIAPLLASADPAAGEQAFRKCAACHTIDEGGANKVGPNLWNMVNRPVATVDGFSYSGALQEFAEGGATVWDYEHLNGFLEAPRRYVRGTVMGFAGVKKAQERADLIAYMRQQAAEPAPLPE